MAFDITKKEKLKNLAFIKNGLTDLHIHIGASVAPHVLWRIAHQQGFRLPTKDYWEFQDLITVSGDVKSLDDYLHIMHTWTEKIQSSPLAMEQCVYEIITKEYRSSNVSNIELRFNPAKRNLKGERDLDQIISATLRGLDQAKLDYGCKAGLIFCMAREFDVKLNSIIIDKAIKFRDRGVVGLDVAGSETHSWEKDDELMAKYSKLLDKAKDAKLGVTWHTGETKNTGPDAIKKVIKFIKPSRIGHGIQAYHDPETMKMLSDNGVTLELCPSSNLWCKSVKNLDEYKELVTALLLHNVNFTVNTDGTYMLKTNLLNEYKILYDNNILTEKQINNCIKTANEVTFNE